MMLTGQNGTAIGQLGFSSDATQRHPLGLLALSSQGDGRKFRYVKAGAAALVVGNMIQAPAQITDADQLAVQAAAAAGATQISVTTGGTNAIVANQYAGGWAVITVTPGLGYFYKIGSHPAAAITTTLVLTLGDGETVQVALTTSSKVTLVPNPYGGVIQTPITTLTGIAVGAAIYPIAISEYGWIQSGGPAGVLIAGTPGVGLAVVVPGTAAGVVVVDGAASATQVVGSMMVTGVDGKVQPVYLTLD